MMNDTKTRCFRFKRLLFLVVLLVLGLCFSGCDAHETDETSEKGVTSKGQEKGKASKEGKKEAKETISVCVKRTAFNLLKNPETPYFVTTYEYDAYGNCIEESTNYPDGDPKYRVFSREYDDKNRIVRYEDKDITPNFTHRVEEYKWKDDQHVTMKTSYPGQRTASKTCDITYDEAGNMVSKEYYKGDTYSYVYDKDGNLTEVIYTTTDKKKCYHEFYSYDEKGREIEYRHVKNDEESVWEYQYAEDGNTVETVTLYNGEFYRSVVEEYNDRGDVVRENINDSDGSHREYSYMYEYGEIEISVKH